MTINPKDELHHHHHELHKHMQAAAENYSMAKYHSHLFVPDEIPVRHSADTEA